MAQLNELINVTHPVIMAPMFLVTNLKMMMEAQNAGIAGCIPAHNFRKNSEFEKVLDTLSKNSKIAYGVNIIANKSNIYLNKQLKTVLKYKVPFIITSLGNPKKIIESCKPLGIKVFCDVVDLKNAKKVEELGCDAVIAVNNMAGGHSGGMTFCKLIPSLTKELKIPVISAGGVGNKEGMKTMLDLGAVGVSVGSSFIASTESDVSLSYKNACVKYGASDIVITKKLSGTPCSVINTPYVKEMGTTQNILEKILFKNKKIKKYIKMLVAIKGFKTLEKAAFSSTYKTVWVAGPSIEYVKEILPIKEIVKNIVFYKG